MEEKLHHISKCQAFNQKYGNLKLNGNLFDSKKSRRAKVWLVFLNTFICLFWHDKIWKMASYLNAVVHYILNTV